MSRIGAGRLATAATAGILGSLAVARWGDENFVDRTGALWRRTRGRGFDRVVAATTDIGSVFGLAGSTAVVATAVSPRTALDVAGAGITAWVLGQGAKPVMDRGRPYEGGLIDLLVHPPAGSSWPSGHTAVASAVATVLAARGPRTTRTAIAVAGWVGWSRVYVGAHHPTDVVAGAGIGILSALGWEAAGRLFGRTGGR